VRWVERIENKQNQRLKRPQNFFGYFFSYKKVTTTLPCSKWVYLVCLRKGSKSTHPTHPTLSDMKNLAPNITRQRFLIEGFVNIKIDKNVIKNYFNKITNALNLRMYGEPIIFSPSGDGKTKNQGFDAFVPLIDSGISLYYWSSSKFLSVVIYTCKSFDENKALATTKEFFKINKTASRSF